MSVLEAILDHEDLVRLDEDQRETLCREIRDFLVTNISKTGGHLASNLGVVELSVALETVFNTEIDRLVFDVGHQSYVHKLLTGRRADFAGLRQLGGMSGFPKPSESDADAFTAGHASSSVSIALGMARARTLQKQDYHVAALLGDGAATGGMIYEGLNDAAESGEPLVVILNDNAMSIDRNVGGFATHLSALRTKEGYLGIKRWFRIFTAKLPGGYRLYRILRASKNWLRRMLIPTTIFENMGLEYLGPVDGHDVNNLVSVLNSAIGMQRPVLVHVITLKGKGYVPAETDPCKFHGVGAFDLISGETVSTTGRTFSHAFGEALCDIAREDSRVCAITAAMPGGTGLLSFKEQFPNRLFDVGIAEEHAVSMAGGLAKQGMVPVVAIYSTFLQRAYDQIIQDVGLQRLHVVFAVDRAGLVGEDGETHHGVFDVGYLSQVPGMTVLCPANTTELKSMLRWAVMEHDGPVAIRYPRGVDGELALSEWVGRHDTVVGYHDGDHVSIVTYGTMINPVYEACNLLRQQGINPSLYRMQTVAPVEADRLLKHISPDAPVVIVEDTCKGSGIKEKLAWELRLLCPAIRVFGLDLGEGFVTHGEIEALQRDCGVDAQSICRFVMEVLKDEN